MVIFLKLLTVHFVADFFFQTEQFCLKKSNLCTMAGWFYQVLHAFVHSVLSYLVLMDWCNWVIPVLVFVSHFVIDVIKSMINVDVFAKTSIQRSNIDCSIFILDQIFHIVVLWLLSQYCICQIGLFFGQLQDISVWCYIVAYIVVLNPTSIFICKFVQRWQDDILQKNTSLIDAGMWIGYAERVLALTFVLLKQYEALGFLIAAKSLLRFQETDTKQTEYVLIGTLFSFGVAVLLGLLCSCLEL